MRPLLLLALLLLPSGCQQRASSMAEAETDGAVADAAPADAGPTDAAPAAPDAHPDPTPEPDPDPDPDPAMCAYTPEPLGECTALEHPPAACTLHITGDHTATATFDAAGAQTSWIDGAGDGYSLWPGPDGGSRHDSGEGHCVHQRTIEWPGVERALDIRVTRDGAECALTAPHPAGRGITELDDAGCDCVDVRPTEHCVYGEHGPTVCTAWRADGAIRRIEAVTYDAAGRIVERQVDSDGDGAWDLIQRSTYDAEGRIVEYHRDCIDCPPAASRRETTTYETDGEVRIVTITTDIGDDGQVDRIVRRTIANNLVLRLEIGDGDGFHTVVENEYREGFFRSTTTEYGQVISTQTREVEGDEVVETRVVAEGTRVTRTRSNAAGMLVERSVTFDPGGTLTERLTWDGDTRLVAEEVTYDGQPALDCAVAYRWTGDCPAVAGRPRTLCPFEPPW